MPTVIYDVYLYLFSVGPLDLASLPRKNRKKSVPPQEV